MRTTLLFLLFFAAVSPLRAGQIIVYNQVWRGTEMTSTTETRTGKGYILLDIANHKLTRISTSVLGYFKQKTYFVESFASPMIAELGSNPTTMAVTGANSDNQFGALSESILFMKGKEILVAIGPSQLIKAPKTMSGVFKKTVSPGYFSHLVEDNFTIVFNASVTNDTNANSRTLEAEVTLLTDSLKAAGYQAGSR